MGINAVVNEIHRRGFYTHIASGRPKYADILAYNPETTKKVRIVVKAKQGGEWPGVRGINNDQTLLILVDYEDKDNTEKPDFYILDANDWQDYLKKHVIPNPKVKRLIDGYIPEWKDGWIGTSIKPHQVLQHKEKWEKLERKLS